MRFFLKVKKIEARPSLEIYLKTNVDFMTKIY